ncbi:ABC transporter permease [Caulobacter sp. KR2-114]|uniref:ABC transporter permease n=1 Tax=Caulobacter sp. KR2-114 TaxID=3400912 RepID=UPI003C123BAD
MRLLRQTLAITILNIRSIPGRLGSALVTAVSVSSVVAVLVGLLGLQAGAKHMATQNVAPNRAIVMPIRATAEYMGTLTPSQVAALGDLPTVARDASGAPQVAPMVVVMLEAEKKGDGAASNIVVRGLSPAHFAMLQPTRIAEGRGYTAGVRELVVGSAVRQRYRGFELGNKVRLRGGEWTVVGIASSGGGMDDNTIFADDAALMSLLNRTTYQSVLVDLKTAQDYRAFEDAVSTDPRLAARAMLYKDFLAAQVRKISALLTFLAYFIGAVMGVGATFAAINAMFAAIDARRKEIATLRAIGFPAGAILGSIVAESLCLCLPAGLVGILLAWVALNGQGAAASHMSFHIAITLSLGEAALAWALIIGLLGGAAPAIVAARLPVATALRTL